MNIFCNDKITEVIVDDFHTETMDWVRLQIEVGKVSFDFSAFQSLDEILEFTDGIERQVAELMNKENYGDKVNNS